ncbi:MAG: hypothetical protein H6622_10750 [Halobacteriovoraceae bacterium]|nr:hypothetical protein [Halobacteriovoraceae bacterium]
MIKTVGFLFFFFFNNSFAHDYKNIFDGLDLNDLENDDQYYINDQAPIISPIKSTWKKIASQEYQHLGSIAEKYARSYVNKFFDQEYRIASSTNREMFDLGKKRFEIQYGRSGKYFKGYVLGAEGEHILSGTDCTRFLHKIWDHVIKINFAKPNVTFPYTVTLILHDIAKAWELTFESAPKKTDLTLLKEIAFKKYNQLLLMKWRTINKEAKKNHLPRLPREWVDINLDKFHYYEFIPNFEDAVPGDIVLKVLSNKRHLERGHAYMYLEQTGQKAGIGAQSGKKGLAYNKHFSHRFRYILRPNLTYIRSL